MNIIPNGYEPAILKDIKLYKDKNPYGNEQYYLSVIYGYENDRGKYELYIPKILVPIRTDTIPVISQEFGGLLKEPMTIDLGFGELTVMPGGKNKYELYHETVLERKTRKMTLSEIEEELGYKIEIVREK